MDRRVCGLVIELLTWRLGTLLNLVVVAGGDCRETHLKPKPTTRSGFSRPQPPKTLSMLLRDHATVCSRCAFGKNYWLLAVELVNLVNAMRSWFLLCQRSVEHLMRCPLCLLLWFLHSCRKFSSDPLCIAQTTFVIKSLIISEWAQDLLSEQHCCYYYPFRPLTRNVCCSIQIILKSVLTLEIIIFFTNASTTSTPSSASATTSISPYSIYDYCDGVYNSWLSLYATTTMNSTAFETYTWTYYDGDDAPTATVTTIFSNTVTSTGLPAEQYTPPAACVSDI